MPNEHAENAGTRKRRNPEEASALDPVENSIRRLQPSGERKKQPLREALTKGSSRPFAVLRGYAYERAEKREKAVFG